MESQLREIVDDVGSKISNASLQKEHVASKNVDHLANLSKRTENIREILEQFQGSIPALQKELSELESGFDFSTWDKTILQTKESANDSLLATIRDNVELQTMLQSNGLTQDILQKILSNQHLSSLELGALSEIAHAIDASVNREKNNKKSQLEMSRNDYRAEARAQIFPSLSSFLEQNLNSQERLIHTSLRGVSGNAFQDDLILSVDLDAIVDEAIAKFSDKRLTTSEEWNAFVTAHKPKLNELIEKKYKALVSEHLASLQSNEAYIRLDLEKIQTNIIPQLESLGLPAQRDLDSYVESQNAVRRSLNSLYIALGWNQSASHLRADALVEEGSSYPRLYTFDDEMNRIIREVESASREGRLPRQPQFSGNYMLYSRIWDKAEYSSNGDVKYFLSSLRRQQTEVSEHIRFLNISSTSLDDARGVFLLSRSRLESQLTELLTELYKNPVAEAIFSVKHPEFSKERINSTFSNLRESNPSFVIQALTQLRESAEEVVRLAPHIRSYADKRQHALTDFEAAFEEEITGVDLYDKHDRQYTARAMLKMFGTEIATLQKSIESSKEHSFALATDLAVRNEYVVEQLKQQKEKKIKAEKDKRNQLLQTLESSPLTQDSAVRIAQLRLQILVLGTSDEADRRKIMETVGSHLDELIKENNEFSKKIRKRSEYEKLKTDSSTLQEMLDAKVNEADALLMEPSKREYDGKVESTAQSIQRIRALANSLHLRDGEAVFTKHQNEILELLASTESQLTTMKVSDLIGTSEFDSTEPTSIRLTEELAKRKERLKDELDIVRRDVAEKSARVASFREGLNQVHDLDALMLYLRKVPYAIDLLIDPNQLDRVWHKLLETVALTKLHGDKWKMHATNTETKLPPLLAEKIASLQESYVADRKSENLLRFKELSERNFQSFEDFIDAVRAFGWGEIFGESGTSLANKLNLVQKRIKFSSTDGYGLLMQEIGIPRNQMLREKLIQIMDSDPRHLALKRIEETKGISLFEIVQALKVSKNAFSSLEWDSNAIIQDLYTVLVDWKNEMSVPRFSNLPRLGSREKTNTEIEDFFSDYPTDFNIRQRVVEAILSQRGQGGWRDEVITQLQQERLRPTTRFRLPKSSGIISIGRDENSDFMLDDRNVSRSHAQIRKDAVGTYLVDTRSLNGTTINGTPVVAETRVPLFGGEKLVFGKAIHVTVVKRGDELYLER